MNTNKGMGTRKPVAIPYISATNPISGGKMAPPATAITKKEAPCFVREPNDLIERANIVGNMMDIKKKTPYNAISEIQPNSIATTGNKRQHANAYNANIRDGLKYFIKKLPEMRPIINKRKPNERK